MARLTSGDEPDDERELEEAPGPGSEPGPEPIEPEGLSPEMRQRLVAAGALLLLLGSLAVRAGSGIAERFVNRVAAGEAAPLLRPAAELHGRLLVADLHADTLLWERDLWRRSDRGHVDLPRLLEGNVAVQVFTVVTKMPFGAQLQGNTGSTDIVLPLVMWQRWPFRTWGSLHQRALHQGERLQLAAAQSQGRLVPVRTRAELAAFLERRRQQPKMVAALLGLEGAHALEGRLENLAELDAAGFRMIGLAHFFDNEFSGSAHGRRRGGLTPAGRELVRAVESRRMLLDLAHASPAAVDEALALSTRPVVVSHTGVKGTCDNPRNLSDAHLRGIARTGGLVGIGFWPTAVCGPDERAIARAVVHAVRVAGSQHVALGSDFDGAVTTPFDARGLPRLTQALLQAGLSEAEVAQVMGGNVLRVLRQALP